jgi:hypothetical protein
MRHPSTHSQKAATKNIRSNFHSKIFRHHHNKKTPLGSLILVFDLTSDENLPLGSLSLSCTPLGSAGGWGSLPGGSTSGLSGGTSEGST